MKKRKTNQNGGLTVCSFCFNAGPGEETKAIQPSWRLFRFGLTIPSRTSPSASGFRRFFEFLQHGQTAVRRSVKFYTRRGRSKKFQHFLSQRKKSSLTSDCIVKGKISGRIKGFSGLISNANRTEWSPIRSLIIRVFITCMITGTA